MAYTDDHIALAAEYALGTLDAEERAQVATMMAVDPAFAEVVQAWEFRLGVLNQMVGNIEPRPIVWENIRAEIARIASPPQPSSEPVQVPADPPALPAAEPGAPEPVAAAPSPARESEPPSSGGDAIPDIAPQFVPQTHAPDPAVRPIREVPVVDDTRVILLEGRVKRWRTVASAIGALAAALLVTLSLQILQPDALPGALRPPPRIQTVQVKAPPPLAASAQYVALLQGQAGGPAFIMTIDGATRNFTVRKVGATPEPGKSFELWLISDKLPRPRSLGVIGGGDFTARPVLASYDPDVVNGATYAVTIEQAGGSPNGEPSSAPVFSGKLIETVPPAPQPQAPAKR
jgi:anti-sigma-K factor RskA